MDGDAAGQLMDRAEAGTALIRNASRLIGLPYIFGGAPEPGVSGTDCSGLTQFGAAGIGVTLSRTTYGQYLQYVWDQRNGHRLSPHAPGDLLFIPGADAIASEPGHVMIYVRPGEVLQAECTGTLIGLYPYDTTVFEYRTRPALAFNVNPPELVKYPHPTPRDLARAGLVAVNVAQANLAHRNGWNLYHWDQATGRFVGVPVTGNDDPLTRTEYANRNFRRPR